MDEKWAQAKESQPEVGPFRTILPQILASTAKNILLLDLGLALCFSTIVIPALTGDDKEHNPDEILRITPEQASWLGSVSSICQPIGALCSGILAGPIGRKRAMFIVNIPHIIAWGLLYFSKSLTQIFTATVILGLGTGLMEAPTITYIGEISQPSIRGTLTACSGISASLGFFVVFLLGSILPWRQVALCCGAVPIVVLIALCFIPETPLWLLSKNRTEDALKSLQWLRGWVSPNGVKDEFQALQRYNIQSLSCPDCLKREITCTHPPPTIPAKLKDLLRRRTIKPFMISLVLFFFAQFSGYPPMRPFLVLILKAYGVPINPNWATTILGLMALIGNITLVCIIRFFGKRRVFMMSISGAIVCCISLSIYGFICLPSSLRSLGGTEPVPPIGNDHYFPLIVFIAFAFFTNLGIWSIPWMMLSEVFPFKSREFAAGISASLEYITMFISNKTYLDLEAAFTIPGVTIFYGCFGVIGLILAYYILPETENRSLEEIEMHFSDKSIKITDINIKKMPTKVLDNGDVKPTKGFENIAYIKDHC